MGAGERMAPGVQGLSTRSLDIVTVTSFLSPVMLCSIIVVWVIHLVGPGVPGNVRGGLTFKLDQSGWPLPLPLGHSYPNISHRQDRLEAEGYVHELVSLSFHLKSLVRGS